MLRWAPVKRGFRQLSAKRQCPSRTLHGSSTHAEHLRLLLQNPELDETDAENELRWMKAHLREIASPEVQESSSHSKIILEPLATESALFDLVNRRAQGEPLQYILATTDFGALTLLCRSPTLIPRPETAHIFTLLAHRITSSRVNQEDHPGDHLKIVDLCTGSAPIPLLLSQLLKGSYSTILGYDYSAAAVRLAEENIAYQNKLGNESKNVKVYQGDILNKNFASSLLLDLRNDDHENADGRGKVDILVSNPPYISQKEWERLPKSVKDYEDSKALIGGIPDQSSSANGLAFYECIAQLLPQVLTPSSELSGRGWNQLPRIAVEIGHDQGEDVKAIFGDVGMRCEVWLDQFERDRMVVGWDK